MDKINIVDINKLLMGGPSEHPVHCKRKRAWNPSPSVAVPQSVVGANAASVTAAMLAPLCDVDDVDGRDCSPQSPYIGTPEQPASSTVLAESGNGIGSSSSTPKQNQKRRAQQRSPGKPPQPHIGSPEHPSSSAMSVESGILKRNKKRRAKQRSSRKLGPELSDANVNAWVNYGSEPESDEDADDEINPFVASFIPRVYRSVLETPVDDFTPAVPDWSARSGDADVLSTTAATGTLKPTVNVEKNALGLNGFYEFQWTSFPDCPIPPESRREIFSNSIPGPTIPCDDAYETFIAIWDRQIMDHIASETNRYAQLLTAQLIENNALSPRSRICDWQDTSVDELYVYFALVLAMGIVVKSTLAEYWNANKGIFYTPGFGAKMSIRRFQLLSRCLHFNNNEDMCALKLDASEAKLFKIQPVLSHLNTKFQSLYNMRQNIALDESLLRWNGWLDINQLISHKAAAVGVKTYEICECQTGYLWRFEVHAQKKGSLPTQPLDPLGAPTPATVLRLIQGLENKGHTLCMDNFYNSPALARRLKTLGFDCVGTLRTNRQFVPEALNHLTPSNMRPGDITGLTSGDVDLMVWRDQNRIAMISTYHGNAVDVCGGTLKPIMIIDYNIMMGGVDKKDQMLAMYPIERKRTRVWYKKLFRRLLNVSVLNAYILMKQFSPLSHRSFRITLIKSLLARHSNSCINNQTDLDATQCHINKNNKTENVYDVKDHYLAETKLLPNNTRHIRRACVQCKKRVIYYCVGCFKSTCISPCFRLLHQ